MAYLEREQNKQVYFEDYGSGDNAIVLIHGWGMGVRTWDYTLPALVAAGYRVVALDHRGCGKSDMDFADMGIASIAGDVVAIVKSLGLKQVVLNGWSLGGAVAVEAASQLGETCCGLVLTCGATPVYFQKSDYPYGGTAQGYRQGKALVGLSYRPRTGRPGLWTGQPWPDERDSWAQSLRPQCLWLPGA